ncbi:MAG: Rrf2 family transcriptional regulator [Gammaproteobacteria bacterium]
MRLTKYSDFALRTLIYMASAGRRCTIDEIAQSYSIPKNHLVKVVNQLATLGFIHSIRGKGGGIELAYEPTLINLGEVIRATEQSFDLVECFSSGNECVLTPSCQLANIFSQALDQFMAVLDDYTLADISTPKIKVLLNLN